MKIINFVFQNSGEKKTNRERKMSKFAIKHMDKFLAGLGPADQAILKNPTLKEFFQMSMRNSFQRGPYGAMHDLKLLRSQWKVDFEKLNLPIFLWHGEQDKVVPCDHSSLLQKKIPNSQAFIVKNEGHYSLPVTRLAEIMKPVVEMKRRS